MNRLLAVKNLKTDLMCGHPIVEKTEERFRCLKCGESLNEEQKRRCRSKVAGAMVARETDFMIGEQGARIS